MKTLRVTFLFWSIAFLLFGAGCGHPASSGKPDDVSHYTCTMHPSVKSLDPKAKCPICSMDLVPVMKQGASASPHDHEKETAMSSNGSAMPAADGMVNTKESDDKPHEFTIPLDRQQLIGVTYAKVEQTPLKSSIRAAGTVAADKLRHWDYVSRVEGYVQKLAVSSRGEPVKFGQPLLTIYSPDLVAAQREYIEALRIRDASHQSGNEESNTSGERMVESARRRLAIWNLGNAQLNELEKSRQVMDTLTLSSPFDGVVLELMTNQGARVMPGDHLVDVADLSVVWVWAEFYQEELPLVKPGGSVVITSSGYPNEKMTGKITVVDPFLNESKRTGRVRIDVENPEMKLRPDMYVNVDLNLDLGEGLTVPLGAVLPTGERNIVFVNKGQGRLEPRFIELGRKFGDRYAVSSGLKEGEQIVSSANFLIDAEAKVQGALRSW